MGFCMGVRRAVQIMQDEATPERPVHSVGEIVHNPYVVQRLSDGGVRQLPGPDEVDGDVGALIASELPTGRVAITAHGVGARVMEDLEATGLEIVDTTCPIVTRAQRYAQKFIRDGYHVLVLGDPGHKEVRGIMGWTDDASGKRRATIVRTPDLEAVGACMDSFEDGFPSKIGVMVQTTHKVEDFAEFVSNLMVLQRDRNFELHVVNTLCHATTGQQEAAAALARDVEVVVVVGGKKSANTRHLREVCEEQGTTAYHIESPDELQREWFEGIERIGLTAGASTPDYSIDETEARLREMLGA
ncbi:MAG: 4-hydroxy-3-methylbut-2-enyl diphosphate reductase [Dehalococcoidia bacterium]|nr:4-hydroxy-3-methylbut-2-enyl diphosphate reductase [Dehalococcoidia bacterium]